MAESWETTNVNGIEVTTDDPKVKSQLQEAGAELVPYSEENEGINPAVIAGGVAGIAAAGYGLYRFGKWAVGKIRSKTEENAVKKLQKKGYIIIPQRDSEAGMEVVDEESFEDDPVEEVPEPEEPPKKATKKK